MLNVVTLVGRPTKDPEIKIIGEGTVVCNFTLAVNRPYTNKDGEDQADFINCQAWGKQAEFLGTWVGKGQLIGVVGSINTRTYQKDDVTHYVTEVNVSSVQALERSKREHAQETEEFIKAEWNAEWNKRSVGLDAKAKASLKAELTKKYQPRIDALTPATDLPF